MKERKRRRERRNETLIERQKIIKEGRERMRRKRKRLHRERKRNVKQKRTYLWRLTREKSGKSATAELSFSFSVWEKKVSCAFVSIWSLEISTSVDRSLKLAGFIWLEIELQVEQAHIFYISGARAFRTWFEQAPFTWKNSNYQA